MKFYSPQFYAALTTMSGDEQCRMVDQVSESYVHYLENLKAGLPGSIRRLVEWGSFHDGKIVRLDVQHDVVELLIRGDLPNPEFDEYRRQLMRVRYLGVSKASIRGFLLDSPSEPAQVNSEGPIQWTWLYDEFSIVDGSVHQEIFALVPKIGGAVIEIVFKDCELEVLSNEQIPFGT